MVVSQYNTEAEQAVLGCAMISAETVPHIVASLTLEDWSEAHRPWFFALMALFRRGGRIDAVTLLNELHEPDPQMHAKAHNYAMQIIEVTPTAANLDIYIDLMREASRMRDYQAAASEILSSPTTESARPAIERLISAMDDRSSRDTITVAEGWERFYQRHESGAPTAYIETGLRQLDRQVKLRKGKFLIIGGYPSDGKTALALQMCLHMARNHRVGLFSLETDHDDLMDRIAPCLAGVSFSRVMDNAMTDDDWDKCANASKDIQQLKLDLTKASGYTVELIRAKTRAGRYEVVFVDYAQIIKGSRNAGRFDTVTDISMELHNLAQQAGVLVVALSQLTRPPKDKNGKVPPPSMSSLRESGQLEQDADAIILLTEQMPKHIQEQLRYHPKPMSAEYRSISVVKNKTGRRNGNIPAWLIGDQQRFQEIRMYRAETPPPEEPKPEQEFIELPDDTKVPF